MLEKEFEFLIYLRIRDSMISLDIVIHVSTLQVMLIMLVMFYYIHVPLTDHTTFHQSVRATDSLQSFIRNA